MVDICRKRSWHHLCCHQAKQCTCLRKQKRMGVVMELSFPGKVSAPELVAPTNNLLPGLTLRPCSGEGIEAVCTHAIFLQRLSRA